MRIPRKFGERTPHFNVVQNEKRKYILAYEGHVTEVQYFAGIVEKRAEIDIDPIIEIFPMLRSIPQLSHSHPNHVFNLLKEHLEQYNSVKVFVDKIIDFLSEAEEITNDDDYSIQMLQKDLTSYLIDDLNYQLDSQISVDEDLLIKIAAFLVNRFNLAWQIENISKYLNEQQVVYLPDLDVVCLIVDRDKGNFKEDQYTHLVDLCRQKNYRLYISNPTFEFWLLLHSDQVFQYNQDTLLENLKQGKKRYLERALSQTYSGYRKECIQFERFLPDIRRAINNEKQFCENVDLLISHLGSNIGVLLEEMIRK